MPSANGAGNTILKQKFDMADELHGMVFNVEEFWSQYRKLQPIPWNGQDRAAPKTVLAHIKSVIEGMYADGRAFMANTQSGFHEAYYRSSSPDFRYIKPDHFLSSDGFLDALATGAPRTLETSDALAREARKAGCKTHRDVILRALSYCRDYAPSVENGKLKPIDHFKLDSLPSPVDPETGKRRSRRTRHPKKFDT